jgi:alanine-glyoxylate transaminase/serine-glyoxylate transaminase/serine-pyruvate transaminase
MESVGRQFATNEHVLVIRNGWFSYRWTEIFEAGGMCKSHTVLMAEPTASGSASENATNRSSSAPLQYAPHSIDQVVDTIYRERPAVCFAPHVETSTGMILSDDYIRKAAAAMHANNGLFVLDCIASGAIWADMHDLGVDVVISAPQKGWTGPPCAALIAMSERAHENLQANRQNDTSFSMSLYKWTAVMSM